LRYRVTPSGVRSFLFEKKVKGGRRIAVTLGRYPEMSLAQARYEALQLTQETQSGIDPVQAASAAKAEEEALRAREVTVGSVLDVYIQEHVRRNLKEGQSREERERQLRTFLAPLLKTSMSSLSRAKIQAIVDRKANDGKLTMANRLKAALCAFTRWAYLRDFIDTDPGARVQKAAIERPRTRTPSLHEVHEIWLASRKMGELWGPYFRLTILLGQRCREEVLRLRWDWVSFEKRRLVLPNTKNNKPHQVHLPEPAITEMQALYTRQLDAELDSPFLFTTTGLSAASGVSKAKKRLDEIINARRRAEGRRPIEHWVLHDLRRTMATELAERGVNESIVDRIQNHVASGSRPSQVSAVYQQAEMLAEREQALETWAALVTACEPSHSAFSD
jgi:integrase